MFCFKGYPDCDGGIGISTNVNLNTPFEPVLFSKSSQYVKSVHEKQLKKENHIVQEIEKTVVSNNKREREDDQEHGSCPSEIKEWIQYFTKMGESGSIGLVPISFQKDFMSGKTRKIKYEETDEIKTVQNFLIFRNKKKSLAN